MIPVARKVLLVALAAVATLIMQRYVGEQTIYAPDYVARRDSLHHFILTNSPPAGRTWSNYGSNGTNIRILTVYLAEGIHRVLGISVRAAYFLIDSAALFASILALFVLLRLWVPPPLALAGVLYVCLVLPLTYALHYFHPWDRLSFLVWIGLVYLLRTHRLAVFGVLLVIGVLVKYDVVLVPGLYFLANVRKDNAIRVGVVALLLFGLSFGIYLGLRAQFGGGTEGPHLADQITRNLSDIRAFHIWYPPLLAFALPVSLAALGVREADRFARAAALFGVLLVIPLFLGSNFAEVRTEMPILLLLLPCALLGLARVLPGPSPQQSVPA